MRGTTLVTSRNGYYGLTRGGLLSFLLPARVVIATLPPVGETGKRFC